MHFKLSLVVSLCAASLYAQQGEHQRKSKPTLAILLKVETRKMKGQLIKPGDFSYAVATTSGFMAFGGSREFFTMRGPESIRPIKIPKEPLGATHFSRPCTAGDSLVLAASSYSKAQETRENNSVRGDFRPGPQEKYMVIIDPDRIRFLRNLPINRIENSEGSSERIETGPFTPQSCYWDGRHLLIGSVAGLMKLQVSTGKVDIIDESEMSLNRVAAVQFQSRYIVAEDEGGAAGGCMSEIWFDKSGKRHRSGYCLMGFNNWEIAPSQFMIDTNRLFVSSLAGLIEIDENRFIQYKLSTDPKNMRIFDVQSHSGFFWGTREDGLVQVDLKKRSATVYTFDDSSLPQDIRAYAFFKGEHYVSTAAGLFLVKLSDTQ